VASASISPSTIAGVWWWQSVSRRSDSPGGTEGGRMPGTKKPSDVDAIVPLRLIEPL
jgi:hypothetical protein